MVGYSSRVNPDLCTEMALCACFHLRKAARAVTQLYDESLRSAGLRMTQATILAALAVAESRGQPLTIKRLAEILVMDRTTLTRDLRPMIKRGLVALTVGTDRRSRRITLTRSGHKALETLFPLWRQVQKRVVQALGAKRWTRLLNDLSAVVESSRRGP